MFGQVVIHGEGFADSSKSYNNTPLRRFWGVFQASGVVQPPAKKVPDPA
jgi:hypothetical protein